MLKSTSIILLTLCSALSVANAQTPASSDGVDFFVSYIKPTLISAETAPVYALVGAYQDDSITFSYFDPSGKEVQLGTFWMKGKTTKEFPLNQNTLYDNLIESQPRFGAYRVRAQSPISLQVYSTATTGTELYLALPRLLLGNHYVVTSFANTAPIVNDPPSRSAFEVIAIKPNTRVAIRPTAPLSMPLPDTVLMQKGQVLWVRAASAFGDDLTGSVITSDQPIAVLAGHEGAALPQLNGIGNWNNKLDDVQNMLIEEMLPVKDWKSSGLLSIPFEPEYRDFVPRDTGDLYRIVTPNLNGGTTEGRTVADQFDTIWTSPFLEYPYFEPPFSMSTRDSVAVAMVQYDYYQGKTGGAGETIGYTSPVMMDIIPKANWKQEYLWRVPSSSIYRGGQLLSIIYDMAAPPIITFEGVGLAWQQRTHTNWSIPGHPELLGLTINVSAGSYYATSSKPFIVYSYGHSQENYKINAGYASPCGTLGTESSTITSLTTDSTCGAWTGLFVDSQAVVGDGTRFFVFLDSALAKRNNARLSQNVAVAVDTIDAQTWKYNVTVIEPLRAASVSFYLSDDDGLHLIRTLVYSAPALRPLAGANFKRIQINSDSCSELTFVNNSNSVSYTIESIGLLRVGGEFRITGTNPPLPITLGAHDSIQIFICALTTIADSTIQDTLRISTDCFSISYPLSLYAVAPRVNWLEHDTSAELVCGVADTVRLWLVNDNLRDGSETISDITLQGPDATEFAIVRNQLGYSNFKNFPLDPGERIWFDVRFQPDMSKPIALRYADRHAILVAQSSLNTTPEVTLTAHLTHPSLIANANAIDLGRALIPATQQQTLTLTDTGDAPLVVRGFSVGNPKITILGLSPGDTIRPGESVVITILGVSDTPDSIFTSLMIDAYEECANPIVIPITFIPYAPPYHGIHISTSDLALGGQYICRHTGAEGIVINDGTDTVTIRTIEILGNSPDEIQFTGGGQRLDLNRILAPDSAIRFDISVLLKSPGVQNVQIRYTWDSAGTVSYSYSRLTLAGLTASTTFNIGAPIAATGTTPSSVVEVPILFGKSLPPDLNADRVDLTIEFRRDLFRYVSTISRYTQFAPPSFVDDPNGNTYETLHLESSGSPFSAGEAARLRVEVLVAADTNSEFALVDSKFFSATDTLCVDYSSTPTMFTMTDLCGDNLIRNVLRNKSPLEISQVTPNPATNALHCTLTARIQSLATIQLYDVIGRQVLDRRVSLLTGSNFEEIGISNLPAGVYILRVSGSGTTQSRSIQIIK